MNRFPTRNPPRPGACSLLVPVLLLAAGSAQADPLADLNNTLKGLQADTPIKGTLDVQQMRVNDDDKAVSAQLQLDVDSDGSLGIRVGAALLAQMRAETDRHAADPEKPQPTADLLRDIDAARIQSMLSAADTLSRAMQGATAPVSQAATLAGAPATEITMEVPPDVSKKDSDGMKDFKGTLSVWLDPQGVPLAYHRSIHVKYCKFFFCFTADQLRDVSLKVVNGRLVAVSQTDDDKYSGLGRKGNNHTVATLQLK